MLTSEYKAQITQLQQIKLDFEEISYNLSEIESPESIEAVRKIDDADQLIDDAIVLLKYS